MAQITGLSILTGRSVKANAHLIWKVGLSGSLAVGLVRRRMARQARNNQV